MIRKFFKWMNSPEDLPGRFARAYHENVNRNYTNGGLGVPAGADSRINDV